MGKQGNRGNTTPTRNDRGDAKRATSQKRKEERNALQREAEQGNSNLRRSGLKTAWERAKEARAEKRAVTNTRKRKVTI